MRAQVITVTLPLAALVGAGSLTAQVAAPAENPHIGHVTTSFRDTPDQQGFLPVAMADAQTAAQHAGLGMRDLASLEGMKRHGGHVLHAVDPSQIEQGPGSGYGVKKAAENVAAHIEMAAKVEGAPQGVITHSVHVATSARNTTKRAEEIAALAKQVQAAGAAEEARPLFEELNEKVSQLLAGVDANADGRVGWQEGEGGLDTVQQHMNLMLGSSGR